MYAIADTAQLSADGVITPQQAREIEARARAAMVTLAVNVLLCFGILAATGGLILWLAEPLPVAALGAVLVAAGALILAKAGETFRMFGNAAALVGAGLLLGGLAVEMRDNHPELAGGAMVVAGGAVAAGAAWLFARPGNPARFVTGAVLLMGVALHLWGAGDIVIRREAEGAVTALFHLYAAALLSWAGWRTDIRLVSALAVVPFAQALDTQAFYAQAVYVFYSPEPALTILQMALLIAACLALARTSPERLARHARIIAVLAFVVANLAALVGALWGDVVGDTLWGPRFTGSGEPDPYAAWRAEMDAFEARALVISDAVFAVGWAVALAAILLWAAHRADRGLFNASLVFGAIHAYTQLFESFADEPLAWVIGGLAAIPLAWGMRRLDRTIVARRARTA